MNTGGDIYFSDTTITDQDFEGYLTCFFGETNSNNNLPLLPDLNAEQLFVIEEIQRIPYNMFVIQGEAGTGKTVLINHLVKILKSQNKVVKAVSPCASAARNISGCTIHRCFNFKIKITMESLLELLKNSKRYEPMEKIDFLVIDEISMTGGSMLDIIDVFLRYKMNKEDVFFGGVKVIAVGDFCQLPPIKDKHCFESNCWKRSLVIYSVLKENYRQKLDPFFHAILRRMRIGTTTNEDIVFLQKRSRKKDIAAETYLKVYCMRDDVEKENIKMLDKLPGSAALYNVEVSCLENNEKVTNKTKKKIMRELGLYESLKLKIGCRVMVTQNIQFPSLYNGTLGVVIAFTRETKMPIISHECGNSVIESITSLDYEGYSVEFVPLVLAYSSTIHRTQGATVNGMVACLNHIFEMNQAYVACSRAPSSEKLIVRGLTIDKVIVNHKVLAFMKKNGLLEDEDKYNSHDFQEQTVHSPYFTSAELMSNMN